MQTVGSISTETYDSPFKGVSTKLERPAYLKPNTAIPPPREPVQQPSPEVVNRDFTQRFAGENTGMLECAVKHQTIGWLPGPTESDYKPKPAGFYRTGNNALGSWHDPHPDDRYFKTMKIGKETDQYHEQKALS